MFSKSCTANSVSGVEAAAKPAGLQTSQAAIAKALGLDRAMVYARAVERAKSG